MVEMEKGKYNTQIPIIGQGEIAELSRQFKMMAQMIQKNNEELESKVKERTAMLEENEQKLKQLAFYDALTKLPNRRLLSERLSQALINSKRHSLYGAVMFLDLDNFKPINDKYGHEVGDLLLIEASKRIIKSLREVDTVTRFGGDEFVILLTDLNKDKDKAKTDAQIVAEKIRIALCEPYIIKAKIHNENVTIEHRSSASIGISLFLGDSVEKEDILKFADNAMYKAKEAGRNQVKFFDTHS